MTEITPAGATIPEVAHHLVDLDSTELHYVSAGTSGSPIVLVHGWPETWWAFRKLIPLLAEKHRVFAVDLRGFGDSAAAETPFGLQDAADDLHHLVEHLALGPVHLLCQDISGGAGFTFAATHPADVLSFTAVESSIAGFGLEMLADVNAFGSWHVGFLGTPDIPTLLLRGRERALLVDWAYPMMNGTPGAISKEDLDEFVRSYSRPNGWRGTESLYRSIFTDNGATKALAEAHPIAVPVLTIEGPNAPFTTNSFRPVSVGEFSSVHIEGVGHLIAQEAPQQLAAALLEFVEGVDTMATA